MAKLLLINHANFADHYSIRVQHIDKETSQELETFTREWVGLGERNDKPSLTQPDMVDDLATLVSKFVRTGEVPSDAGGFYTEDIPDFPADALRLDKVDRLNMARTYQAESDAIKLRMQERVRESKKAAAQAAATPKADTVVKPDETKP